MVRKPVRSASPAPVTARSPRVFSRGVPYLTARGPAELWERLPPTVQYAPLLGSGGQKKPTPAARSCTAALRTPGSTTINRSSGLTSRMRSIRSRDRISPPATGTDPPTVPVPRPRGTSGTRRSAHRRTTSSTCSGAVAKLTSAGIACRRLLSYP